MPSDSPFRRSLRRVFRAIVGIYFRDIEVTGPLPPKTMEGRILVANHVNGLVDPVLVMTRLSAAVSPVGKATLWKIPGLRQLLDVAGAIPIVRKKDAPEKSAGDNAAVFDKVAEHLTKGGNILIFPEGISHSEPHLVPLKSGAARMLARAKERGAMGLTFQAVGLEFDARDTFRSRALCTFGPVRDVDGLGQDGDALVASIVGLMATDLSELVVEGVTWDERRLIALVADMFATEEGADTLERHNALGRRIEAARNTLAHGNPEALAKIRDTLSAYNQALAAARTSDRAVVFSGRGSGPRGSFVLWLIAPLAWLGCGLFWLPYQLPRLIARKATGDVVSTYKLGAGLVAFPLWTALLVTLAIVSSVDWLGAIAATVLVVTAPLAALYWLDGRERSLEARAPSSTAELIKLKGQRRALLHELTTLRDRVESTNLDQVGTARVTFDTLDSPRHTLPSATP